MSKKGFDIMAPKVGVDAGIVDSKGRILLHQRSDDKSWGLPGGWVERGEKLEETVVREVLEETGLRVRPQKLVGVFYRRLTPSGEPHGSCHILYLCKVLGGRLQVSRESMQLKYLNPWKPLRWHKDHRRRARAALEAWLESRRHSTRR